MSRVGKLPVAVPEGVTVDVQLDTVTIKGKLGELVTRYTKDVSVQFTDGQIAVQPANDSKRCRAMWGTVRSLINNMVHGVTSGFETRLEINGVGFRAQLKGKLLVMSLGYSHDIIYAVPEGITIKCEKPTLLVINGIDKQLVGQVVGELTKLRKVEPYKGKGVYIEGSYIRRKEGKKK